MKSLQAIRDISREQTAVVFTHFGQLQYAKDDTEWQNGREGLVRKYKEILKSYLICSKRRRQLGLVYIYIDWAVKTSVQKFKGDTVQIEGGYLAQENQLKSLIKDAEAEARKELRLRRDHPPRFERVGLVELVDLLNKLTRIEPKLVKLLGGKNGKFTYDSPKFAEAVIRLARSNHTLRAAQPVIRIDEDAEIAAASLSTLLEQYTRSAEASHFFFFSGRYGEPGQYDPINDHAVRTAWLADVPQNRRPRLKRLQKQQAKAFLTSLEKIGARQFPATVDGKCLAPQVISGAGLIMSHTAVRFLPPFMNFKDLTVWVDDHLKRRLHEELGDIPKGAPESLPDATIKQDRHPEGLSQDDTEKARNQYFDRLLRGCLLDYIIREPDNRYTKLLKEIVDLSRTRITKKEEDALRAYLLILAAHRYEKVKECWEAPKLIGTVIQKWIDSASPQHCGESCKAAVSDAIDYAKLLISWPIFTRAIDRLHVADNDWLFIDAADPW
jgi:hypothetical protein